MVKRDCYPVAAVCFLESDSYEDTPRRLTFAQALQSVLDNLHFPRFLNAPEIRPNYLLIAHQLAQLPCFTTGRPTQHEQVARLWELLQ